MAKSNFIACLDVVLAHEGGYVDHPDDPGGATNRGITRRTLADWRGVSPWSDLPKSAVRTLGLKETRDIYRARYWNRVAGDELPAGLDLTVFDFAVNSGPPRAVRYLQAALGVYEDGVPGPITLRAVADAAQKGRVAALIRTLSARRLGFLRSLKIFPVFGRGWTRRVAETEAAALAMCPAAESKASRTKGLSDMDILSGYKTYIVGAFMLVSAIAQLAGVDPSRPARLRLGQHGKSALQLLMESLAVIFLRKGIDASAHILARVRTIHILFRRCILVSLP